MAFWDWKRDTFGFEFDLNIISSGMGKETPGLHGLVFKYI